MLSSKVISAFVILTFVSVSVANRRATHGEKCNRTIRCDSRGSLTCKNGVCECIMPESMTFDARYGRCSVLAGEKCLFTAVEGDGASTATRSWREEMPCILNAQCTDGFCTCFHGFYENNNGTCSIKKGHREDCDTSNACRDEQFLVCTSDKRCDCNETISTYDFSRQMCVRLAGVPCDSPHQLCVNYAYCRHTDVDVDPMNGFDSYNLQQQQQQPISYEGIKCMCQEGYFANVQGLCEYKRGFGEACENNDYCINDDNRNLRLECTEEKICGCNSKISVFDSSARVCRTLAGASCRDDDGSEYCVENSNCFGVCVCSSEYFQTTNGTCELKRVFGEKCEQNDNCQDRLKCNPEEKLCLCDPEKYIYDKKKQKCVGLANSDCSSSDDCITNSKCDWDSNSSGRKCTCDPGYSKSKNGSCLASHEAPCGDHWTMACNTEEGLVCKEGKCACKFDQFQIFHPDQKKCVSEASGPCDERTPCTVNSQCKENENGQLKCKCMNGFVEVDGECQLSFGESCNYTVKCDAAAPLHCIEGRCQCGPLQTYDQDLQKCRGKVGSSCDLEGIDSNNCVQGAKCVKRRSYQKKSRGICKCNYGWKTTNGGACGAIKGFQAEDPSLDSGNQTSSTESRTRQKIIVR